VLPISSARRELANIAPCSQVVAMFRHLIQGMRSSKRHAFESLGEALLPSGS